MLMTQGAQMEPGTLKGPQLVVPDLRAAREELAQRGVEVSDVQVIAGGPPRPANPDDQLDHQGFVFFEDPTATAGRSSSSPSRSPSGRPRSRRRKDPAARPTAPNAVARLDGCAPLSRPVAR
jgi:hypothetical protein